MASSALPRSRKDTTTTKDTKDTGSAEAMRDQLITFLGACFVAAVLVALLLLVQRWELASASRAEAGAPGAPGAPGAHDDQVPSSGQPSSPP